MSSIPANQFVEILPGVLSAGGNGQQNNGLVLTENPRVPIGSVLSFASAPNVAGYFGASSIEAKIAGGGAGIGSGYFGGFDNAQAVPQALLFAQFNAAAAAAWLRGGNVTGLTIPQLDALSGSLSVVMDGQVYADASFSLSGAASFSAAAALIQTALNTSLASIASFTGAIAAESSTFTGSISGNVLSVTTVPSNPLVPGAVIAGAGVTSGTQIDSQLSGTTGGIGTYAVSALQVVASESITATYGILTVTVVASGTLAVGQIVGGAASGTQITALGTGVGLLGTYYVNLTQTVVSGALTTTAPALAVTFDSISGGFLVTAGSRGAQSSAAYATGTLAIPLMLTAATGAMLSQGAAPAAPGSFLTALTNVTQNWVSFMTAFDPDGSAAGGNAQKQAFAAWVNGQLDRYAYVCWDVDPSPTLSPSATSSLGHVLAASASNGTIIVWGPSDYNYAAFIMGMIAAINFEATNGRITLAFKGQSGLVATVTDQTTYQNLAANGYNCYCAFATAAQQFVNLQPGVVTGAFQWADSYVDQIVLNQALQLALAELLTQVNSIPYNAAGYALIEAAMLDPIQMGLNAGIIRTGVVLSNQQIAEINTQAGAQVAQTLQQQGWLVVIQPASPIVRQARGSPTIILYYTDGQSIQKIIVNSILVQ